jgi:predicted amidophosphoribosyltransferase
MEKIIASVEYFLISFTKEILEMIFPTSRSTIYSYKCPERNWGILNESSFEALYCGKYSDKILRSLILASKYYDTGEARRICAGLLADEVIAYLSSGISPLDEFPAIVTVPSTAYWLGERKTDHMQEIFDSMKPHISNFISPHNKNGIISISHLNSSAVHKQTEAGNRSQRLHDASHKFTVNPATLNSKSFILLDDVITTGATMKDCARALREAGAIHIYGISLAH